MASLSSFPYYSVLNTVTGSCLAAFSAGARPLHYSAHNADDYQNKHMRPSEVRTRTHSLEFSGQCPVYALPTFFNRTLSISGSCHLWPIPVGKQFLNDVQQTLICQSFWALYVACYCKKTLKKNIFVTASFLGVSAICVFI